MNRRDFLRVAASGAMYMALHRAGRAGASTNALPNIVIILADDMGFGDLACQNPDSKIPTPNLDRLAAEGVRFTDAHSPSSVCSPTRYGLLTGRYAWRTPLKKGVLWPWDTPLIEADRLTMGGMLQARGYNTACVGKWHLGWEWPAEGGAHINDELAIGAWSEEERACFGDRVDFSQPIGGGPTTRGFDYYFGDDVPNFPPYCFIENNRTSGIPTVSKPREMFGHAGPMLPGWELEAVMPAITEKAAAYIRAESGTAPFNKQPDRPFFLYFPLTAPHTPIAPAAEFIGSSEAGRYGDFVHQVDWAVGEIMRALDESGQAENTLLVFTSDNGSPGRDGTDMNGPPNSVRRYGHNPSHIYRGIKADIWDGGHRVPFLARWPGRIAPGATCGQLTGHVDIMATAAAIVGAPLPADAAEDSFNMLPALLEPGRQPPIRPALVHHSIDGMFAVRRGRWKLILGKGSGGWSKGGTDTDVPGQLYDMVSDPEELHNRYTEHPEVVTELTALLESYQNLDIISHLPK